MKKTMFVALLCLGVTTNLVAQDWTKFYKLNPQYDTVDFYSSAYHEGTVYFKDGKEPLKTKISHKTLADWTDPKKTLYTKAGDFPIDDLLAFEVNGWLFQRVEAKEYKLGKTPWGMVLINGPVKYMLRFSIMSSGSLLEIDEFSKDGVRVGVHKKSSMMETFADHPDIPTKIGAKTPGYKVKDKLKIIEEYNNWVKENDPERYKKSLAPYCTDCP